MAGLVPLFDHAGIDATERTALERIVAGHTTLERALDWGRTHAPTLSVESVLTQDEYTHDVVIPYGNRYLVYDTT